MNKYQQMLTNINKDQQTRCLNEPEMGKTRLKLPRVIQDQVRALGRSAYFGICFGIYFGNT